MRPFESNIPGAGMVSRVKNCGHNSREFGGVVHSFGKSESLSDECTEKARPGNTYPGLKYRADNTLLAENVEGVYCVLNLWSNHMTK